MTLRWQKGEVSNFQYLMFLNTIAGKHIGDQLSYLCFEFISFRPFWWVAGITPLLGKKCWRSGESSRLSVLWFWFDFFVRLVYFFVSLSFRGFSPRFSDFPSYLKSTVPLSNAIGKFNTKNSPSDLSLLITYSFFIYSFYVYDFTCTKVVTAAVSFDH